MRRRKARHPYGVTVGHLIYSPGAVVDGYQEGESWADAVDVTDCAVAWGVSGEPQEANRQGVSVEGSVYGPPHWLPKPQDRLLLPGYPDPFDVVGQPRDWSMNPFTGSPGGTEVLFGRFDG